MTLKKLLTRQLLAALNSRWLNPTPCRYGFIGNANTFDLESLRSEARSQPELTLREFLATAERFAAHPLAPTLAVMGSNRHEEFGANWPHSGKRVPSPPGSYSPTKP